MPLVAAMAVAAMEVEATAVARGESTEEHTYEDQSL